MIIRQRSLVDLKPHQILIGYAGTLGRANTLETFIDAAAILKDDDRFVFALVGEGSEEENLKIRAYQSGAKHVHFFPKVEKEKVPGIIAQFDIGYIGWKEKSLYQYGISPNKLPEFLAAGVPVAHSYSGEADPIDKYKLGFTTHAEDPKALADGIRKFAGFTKKKRQTLSENCKKTAENHYSFSRLAKRMDAYIKLQTPN